MKWYKSRRTNMKYIQQCEVIWSGMKSYEVRLTSDMTYNLDISWDNRSMPGMGMGTMNLMYDFLVSVDYGDCLCHGHTTTQLLFTIKDLYLLVWAKQCHKPADFGNGKHTTCKTWDLGGGVWHCFTRINQITMMMRMSYLRNMINKYAFHKITIPFKHYFYNLNIICKICSNRRLTKDLNHKYISMGMNGITMAMWM